MNATLDIQVRSRWQAEEGEGKPCAVCHDPAWLQQFRLFTAIGATCRGRLLWQPWEPSDILLCQSCHDFTHRK